MRKYLKKLSADSAEFIPDIPSPQNAFAGELSISRKKKNIMMTEWGPYDFRSPIIWNTNPTDTTGIMKFDLIGPKENGEIKRFKGVKDISLMNGTFPATITAVKTADTRTDILIELEYIGSAITTTFGENIAAGKPYTFSFKNFFNRSDFDVLWYAYDFKMHDPIKTGLIFPPTARLAPIKNEEKQLNLIMHGGME